MILSQTILVAENEALALKTIMEALFSLDIEPRATCDGQIAAVWLAQEKFDAIIINGALPPVGQVHLAQKVSQTPINQNTPILLLAGAGDRSIMHEMSGTKNLFVVEKPFSKDYLMKAIRRVPGFLPDERRRFRRIPLSVEVVCREGPRKLIGKTVDLSEYGVQIESERALEERHSINMMFTLPGQVDAIEVLGVVVRRVDERRAGILFTQLNNDAHFAIRQFLATHMSAV